MKDNQLTKKLHLWSDKELKVLQENYSSNNISLFLPNKTKSSIYHKASRLNLKREMRTRKYSVNHNFFKEFAPQMAYLLGWWFSDGSVSKNLKQISIHINNKDKEILNLISQTLNNNRPIKEYNNSSYLVIQSKVLANDLIKLGCIPNKSLKIEFPNIPESLVSHFLRGFFDGDGSIYFNKPNTIIISFLGPYNFLFVLQSKIHKLLKIKSHPISKHKSIFRVCYYGNDARKISFWLYNNSGNLYLKRKRERFENHLRLRKNEPKTSNISSHGFTNA